MNILRLGLILFIITSFSAASLSLVFNKTEARIAEVKTEKIASLQRAILPLAYTFTKASESVTVGYDTFNSEVGKIVAVSPKGYAGNIH